MRCSRRVVGEFSSSHPAAIASSGFRSITQKQKLPPFSFTNSAPRNEISGGEVRAITTSKRRNISKRHEHTSRKLAKFSARRQRLFFPNESDGMRMISMSFQRSRRLKRVVG